MTKKDLTGVGYEFLDTGHKHFLDGKPLTGVTTILGIISKPQLISWAANCAVDYIDQNFPTAEEFFKNPKIFTELLQEARKAHAKKRDKAGDAGTAVHASIEEIIKGAIEFNEGIVRPEDAVQVVVTGYEQINHFIDWAIANKVKFLESEKHLYSKEHWLGGICDFICEIDGEIWIGDVKTSSGIYCEAFFQTAGYQLMCEEMGIYPNIKGHIILNLRKDGTFEEKRSISNDDNKQAFLSALSLYRIKQKVEGQIL